METKGFFQSEIIINVLVRGLVKLEKIQKSEKNSDWPDELGLDPPTHFRVFLGFLDFFNLTKPLSSDRFI